MRRFRDSSTQGNAGRGGLTFISESSTLRPVMHRLHKVLSLSLSFLFFTCRGSGLNIRNLVLTGVRGEVEFEGVSGLFSELLSSGADGRERRRQSSPPPLPRTGDGQSTGAFKGAASADGCSFTAWRPVRRGNVPWGPPAPCSVTDAWRWQLGYQQRLHAVSSNRQGSESWDAGQGPPRLEEDPRHNIIPQCRM